MLSGTSFVSGLIAGVISFAAHVLYIVTTVQRKTKPNRATWWIFTIVALIVLASYYSAGARDTIWIPVSYALGALIIALLSLRYGEGGWTTLDRICIFGAGVSIILWWLFTAPLLALFTNILVNLFGLLPTIRKSYLRPRGENLFAWELDFFASVINLFAVERWAFAIAVYPLYLVFLNGIIAAILVSRRKR